MTSELSFPRLVPDPDGESHFETVEIPVTLQDFAPPAQPFGVSPLHPAEAYGFLLLPAGWHGEMHPSPIPMWIFVLQGEMEFEASDGDRRGIRAGSALLLEDTTGRGHVSRVVGDEDVALAVIRLPGDSAA